MKANYSKSSLFNQISVPEVFLSSIMPRLSGDSLKLYMYLLYLADKGLSFTQKDILAALTFTPDQLNGCLLELESSDLIIKNKDAISINNISEMRLHSLYKPMESLAPDQCSDKSDRISAIDTINTLHFKGFMSTVWYTTIDKWFNLYGFDPEVMVMLFNQCSKYNKLINTNYAAKIAESWHANNIRTLSDLEAYEARYNCQQQLANRISSSLKLGRQLTDFEMSLVCKWSNTYHYDYDVIELALSRSLRSTRISFEFFDKLLTEWHQAGLRTADEVRSYESNKKQAVATTAGRRSPNNNFSDRSSAMETSDQELIKNLIRKDKQS